MEKTLKEITQEYDQDGKLSNTSLLKLKELISSKNQYSAISVAADCKAISLAPEIAKALESEESMIRWNAIAVLLSRFKLVKYAKLGLHHARHDSDEIVRGAAICGLGEILPNISDKSLSKDIACFLIDMFESKSNEKYIDYREDAYEGILAAMNISPLERPPANKPMDFNVDINTDILIAFKKLYLDF